LKIPSYCWVLPRPRKPYNKGGFPLHFEKKLIRFLNNPKLILHPFGGYAEYGIRIDLLREVKPDIIADAHNMPIRDNLFDCVILDPPYSNKYSKELYNTPSIHFRKYMKEAIRVTKTNGYIVFYHFYEAPNIKGLKKYARIAIFHRIWHKLRAVTIFKKL